MKYTNKNNIPGYVVEWLKSDSYDYEEGTYSATTLMQPPRMYALKKKHWDELEVDVADLIAPRYGTAIHDSFEKVEIEGSTQEERMSIVVDGRKITGKPDLILGDKKVTDLKSTSVWTYIYGGKDDDYAIQLSIYKLLANNNGFKVDDFGEICYFFTDWSSKQAKKDYNYPNSRIAVKKIKLMDDDEVLEYIKGRLRLFDSAEKELPECSDEDLWKGKDTFAIMKAGRKSAVKVCDSEKEASNYMTSNGWLDNKDYFIEERKGVVRRCRYCSASKFCEQYWALKAGGLVDE